MKNEIKEILEKLSNDNLDTTKYGDGYQQGLVDVAEYLESNKTAKEGFLKFYSGFYGEEVTNLKQLVMSKFSGEELFEFVTEYAKSLSKSEDVEIITENSSNTKLGGFTDAC